MMSTWTFHYDRKQGTYAIRREGVLATSFSSIGLRSAAIGQIGYVRANLEAAGIDKEEASVVVTEFFRALRSGKLREPSTDDDSE